MANINADPLLIDGVDAVRQSLAIGAPGIALLHLERAVNGTGSWSEAHASIRQAASGPVDGGVHAGLYYGAPAIAFLLHRAAAADERYQAAAATLDQHLQRITRRRLTAAAARMRHGDLATLGEYDLFYGLTGIGALLLQRMPGSDTFADLLRYLTRLTQPTQSRPHHLLQLPGWWTEQDPDPLMPTPGGHANLGMAHGAAGILALLALSMLHGHVVDHHAEAIDRLTVWLEQWRQHDTDGGSWWPQWLTLDDLRTGRPHQPAPGRPSWCYGTPGIARALQLAAIATADSARRAEAERALEGCLTDRYVDQLTDLGLCHGLAGLYQTTCRAAGETDNPVLLQRVPVLAAAMHKAVKTYRPTGNAGLLTGDAGIHIVAETARAGTTSTGWDTCLLID